MKNMYFLFILLFFNFNCFSKTIIEENFDDKGNLVCQHINADTFEIQYEFPGKCLVLSVETHVQCSNINGEIIHIYKNVYRVDNYTVYGFGHEFFGIANTTIGIANGVEVDITNFEKVSSYHPSKLKFFTEKSNFGYSDTPHKVEISYKFGRASTVQKLLCEVITKK